MVKAIAGNASIFREITAPIDGGIPIQNSGSHIYDAKMHGPAIALRCTESWFPAQRIMII